MLSEKRCADVDRMQIGEVADRVGLSLRTIRFYEEAGIITPSARTAGGFRLYSDADVERLELIKKMKPLGFSVEEIGSLVASVDVLRRGAADAAGRERALAHVEEVRSAAAERVVAMEHQLAQSRQLVADLAELSGAQRPDAADA